MEKKLHPSLQNLFHTLPIKVVFHRSEKGGYWVDTLDLPTCYAYGEDLSNAMLNMKQAVFDYFDVPKGLQDLKTLVYQSEEKVPLTYIDPASVRWEEGKFEEIDAALVEVNTPHR